MSGKTKGIKVPYTNGTIFGLEEIEAVARVLQDKPENLTLGPEVEEFEREFARYVGAKYAFGVTSCTTGLHMATQVLGIKEGDEVITTPNTFVATAQPVLKQGGEVVFADIDPKTFNIDPEEVRKKITAKTKAIYVVHYAGQPVDMDPIMEMAKKHDLYVVEDAAHAPGAEYKGIRVGSIGHIGCFSFHAFKNMSTMGEGGMITTNDDQFAKDIPILRCMGIDYSEGIRDGYWIYDVKGIRGEIGNNFRMSTVQGAVGLVQLRKLDMLNSRRRANKKYYDEHLGGLEEVNIPYELADTKCVSHLYPLTVNEDKLGINKKAFLKMLSHEEGILTRTYYFPIYLLSMLKERGYEKGLCPVAENFFFNRVVLLPVHPRLTQEDLENVVQGIKSVIQKIKKK